jgi:hypothetical protein
MMHPVPLTNCRSASNLRKKHSPAPAGAMTTWLALSRSDRTDPAILASDPQLKAAKQVSRSGAGERAWPKQPYSVRVATPWWKLRGRTLR